jgi:hypothetical protein
MLTACWGALPSVARWEPQVWLPSGSLLKLRLNCQCCNRCWHVSSTLHTLAQYTLLLLACRAQVQFIVPLGMSTCVRHWVCPHVSGTGQQARAMPPACTPAMQHYWPRRSAADHATATAPRPAGVYTEGGYSYSGQWLQDEMHGTGGRRGT